MKKRFIDYAKHGGCSKKASVIDLKSLLNIVTCDDLEKNLPDVGIYEHDDFLAISSVDVILPLVNNPYDFGVITVSHVLNDLYSSYAIPQYCLAILGIPAGLNAQDEAITILMKATIDSLTRNNIQLVGGHTLAGLEEMLFGLTAVGHLDKNITTNMINSGDSIILTKALGGSIASIRWKVSDDAEDKHNDVLLSMKQLNNYPSELGRRYNLPHGTDISGFGFIGHLQNLLNMHSVSATIKMSQLPIFDSIKRLNNDEIHCTRQYWSNYEYYNKFVETKLSFTEKEKYIMYDGNVSGALILIVPDEHKGEIIHDLNNKGYTASNIGFINKSTQKGHITVMR